MSSQAPSSSPQPRHCPRCGQLLGRETIEDKPRWCCPACRYVLYESPAAAVAAVVLDEQGRVLLIRRALEPFRGCWALPAGYQELHETPAQCLHREVAEETGIEVEIEQLLDLWHVDFDPRKPANVAVYLCRARQTRLQAGDDALGAAWFPLDQLPELLGFASNREILERVRRSRSYAASPANPDGARPTSPASTDVSFKTSISYKDAGVDIDAKEGALRRARADIRSTFTPGVMADVGLFGGLFDMAKMGCGDQVLVASADGVGTKLDVAKRAGIYDTVGHDLVNHCINDILVQGARPLFFLDYVGQGRFEPETFAALIRGLAQACRAHGIALLGGETAEMPGLYQAGDVDLVGFIIGAVARDKVLDGSKVRAGQVLLGIGSSGLHTNGYSLARRVLFDALQLKLEDTPAQLGGKTVAQALLEPHRAYIDLLWPLLEAKRIAAMAHITGGGLPGNVPRVLGQHDALIDRKSWTVPGLFRLIVEGGGISQEEAYRAFNMGVGMVLIVEPHEVNAVQSHCAAQGEACWIMGRVEAGRGSVRWIE